MCSGVFIVMSYTTLHISIPAIHPIPPTYYNTLHAACVCHSHSQVYLTESEKKKMRRKRSKERQVMLQEQMAVRLLEAPDPRVTQANMMLVYGDQAVVRV
jgi:hypothetical protein